MVQIAFGSEVVKMMKGFAWAEMFDHLGSVWLGGNNFLENNFLIFCCLAR